MSTGNVGRGEHWFAGLDGLYADQVRSLARACE